MGPAVKTRNPKIQGEMKTYAAIASRRAILEERVRRPTATAPARPLVARAPVPSCGLGSPGAVPPDMLPSAAGNTLSHGLTPDHGLWVSGCAAHVRRQACASRARAFCWIGPPTAVGWYVLAPQCPWLAMRTALSWRTETGSKVQRPQSQVSAPQCRWFAMRPQSQAARDRQ